MLQQINEPLQEVMAQIEHQVDLQHTTSVTLLALQDRVQYKKSRVGKLG